jgi:hypothetical protein
MMKAKLSDSGGKLTLLTRRQIGYPYIPFSTCPLVEPMGIGGETLTGIEEEYDMKELLKARRPVVIRAKERVQQFSNGPGDANTTAQINWKVKLTPVN